MANPWQWTAKALVEQGRECQDGDWETKLCEDGLEILEAALKEDERRAKQEDALWKALKRFGGHTDVCLAWRKRQMTASYMVPLGAPKPVELECRCGWDEFCTSPAPHEELIKKWKDD